MTTLQIVGLIVLVLFAAIGFMVVVGFGLEKLAVLLDRRLMDKYRKGKRS